MFQMGNTGREYVTRKLPEKDEDRKRMLGLELEKSEDWLTSLGNIYTSGRTDLG
jgi:hypothetical protein